MVTGYKVITIWLLTIVNDGVPGTTNPWFPIILDGEIHSEIPIGPEGPVLTEHLRSAGAIELMLGAVALPNPCDGW